MVVLAELEGINCLLTAVGLFPSSHFWHKPAIPKSLSLPKVVSINIHVSIVVRRLEGYTSIGRYAAGERDVERV
jgi:hypothetical protein